MAPVDSSWGEEGGGGFWMDGLMGKFGKYLDRIGIREFLEGNS